MSSRAGPALHASNSAQRSSSSAPLSVFFEAKRFLIMMKCEFSVLDFVYALGVIVKNTL